MTDITLELHHLINGKWLAGGGDTDSSTNPADPSEVVGTYATATTDDLDAALTGASEARPAWDRLGVLARGRSCAPPLA